jgi:hypothetical protein
VTLKDQTKKKVINTQISNIYLFLSLMRELPTAPLYIFQYLTNSVTCVLDKKLLLFRIPPLSLSLYDVITNITKMKSLKRCANCSYLFDFVRFFTTALWHVHHTYNEILAVEKFGSTTARFG